MNLMRFLTASLMTLSMVGCCSNRCVMSDPCDPCGAAPSSGGFFSRLWPMSRGGGFGCNSCSSGGCGGCGDAYGDVMDSGCGCGGGSGGMVMGGGMPASQGCACGGQHAAPVPMMGVPSPAPIPRGAPEPIPSAPDLPSMPGSEATTMIPRTYAPQSQLAGSSQPQNVSYEEFQRLPGTIVSGPGAMTAATSLPSQVSIPSQVQQTSASTQPFMAPPPPTGKRPAQMTVPTAARQALWVPSRAY
jgi:hypothetical protein